MNIGIAIFAYNRVKHLEHVLKAVIETGTEHKVYIFVDGAKNDNDIVIQEKMTELIKSLPIENYELNVSRINKGCATSIESGISYVLDRHDSVVILEDDCVPQKNYFLYMDTCLAKYRDDSNVFGISGWAWNLHVDVEKQQADVYAGGRTCSYGWATWRDRWSLYKRDFDILRRILNNQEASKMMGIWGNDFEDMLVDNLLARIDAWDIFWGLKMIEHNMSFIVPYKSLVRNIGFDGSGTHCGTNIIDTEYFDENKNHFTLIDDTNIKEENEDLFLPVFKGIKHENKPGSEKVIVWGIGNLYNKCKYDIEKKYNILAFIDKRKITYYEGLPLISAADINNYEYDKVIIMIKNEEEAKRVKNLLDDNYGIYDKAIIWTELQ